MLPREYEVWLSHPQREWLRGSKPTATGDKQEQDFEDLNTAGYTRLHETLLALF